MVDEKPKETPWEAKCYCQDEDTITKIQVPFGVSSEEHFEEKPMCPSCGNHNLIPVEEHRPPEFTEEKQKTSTETPGVINPIL